MIGTVLVAVTNLYGPGLQNVFGTTPIPGRFWGLPFCFALGILVMDETRKLIVRTYPKVSTQNLQNIHQFNVIFSY
jgi:sodium/potassium-transporting ATPase subunit alpha